MRLRLELFVADLDASIRFYERVLAFELQRREPDYASLRADDVVLGLGPIAKLPDRDPGPGFTRSRLHADRGAGVEIVLEVDDLDEAFARAQSAGHPIADPPQLQPWGLRDFRLADPDGYYLRVTHT
jgi:lactoylglutathione lyase